MGAALSPQSTKLRLSSSSTQRRVLLIVFVVQAGPLSPPTATCAQPAAHSWAVREEGPCGLCPEGSVETRRQRLLFLSGQGTAHSPTPPEGALCCCWGRRPRWGWSGWTSSGRGYQQAPTHPAVCAWVREPLLGSRAWLTLPLPSPSSSTGLTVGAQRDATLGQPLSVTP